MPNYIDEYLVKLGAAVDGTSFRHFEDALRDMAKTVNSATLEMAASIAKWQAAAVSAFAGVAVAAVKMADSVASADQEYRLFGMTMYMNADAAKKLKITIDALGQPLGVIAWDKELSERAERLMDLQDKLQASLAKEDYEGHMQKVREMRFQLTELHVNFEYLEQAIVSGLVQAFGPMLDTAIEKLRVFNNWFADHLPEIRDKVNKYLVPILKDVWRIIKDVVELMSVLGSAFADIINTIAGDKDSLDPSIDRWEKFAAAIEHVVHAVAWLLDGLIKLEKLLVPFTGTLAGAAVGAKIGAFFGPEGALIGAAIGATVGGGVDLARQVRSSSSGGTASVGNTRGGADSQATAQKAAVLAQSVSAKTGIPADLLWAQWAHETGGFTNRGARELNNLAGINVPGGGGQDYRSFGSLEEFGDYYAHLMRPGGRYAGASAARTPAELAGALKSGGYYTDSQRNYTAGIENWDRKYSGVTSSMTVGSVSVNITQPGASPAEIQQRVYTAMQRSYDAQVTRNLNEFAGAYGG